MVRTQTLPFQSWAAATAGQIAWVWVNGLIDNEERRKRIHTHCLTKFDREVCEVCHEPVMLAADLPVHLQDKVYRPSVDGPVQDFQVKFENPPGLGESSGNEEDDHEITVEVEENGDE